MKQLSDEELVRQVQTGSRRCFSELVHRYSQRLFYFLRQRLSTDEDTEDIIQETFLKAYYNINRFDFNYKFSTWLYTMATRLAISFYRKKRITEALFFFDTRTHDPQERMIQEEDQKNLWDLARKLQTNQFQVLWLRYMEELSLEEIATIMKKKQVHIRVLLHRARSNLGKQLKQLTCSEKIDKPLSVEENLLLF